MIIYKTTNNINGKIYIGRDKHNDPKYLGSGVLLWKAIKKYGVKNFVKEIIDTAVTLEELNSKEIFWIKELNSQDRSVGYNIQGGGEGGDWESLSKEQQDHIKKRVSESRTGHIKSQETIEKMRQSLKGKNTGKRSYDVCKKMSINRKGKGLGIKPWNDGLKNPFSKETIEKLRSASLGENNPMYGKHHSDESKEKIRIAAIGRPNPNKGKFSKTYVLFKDGIEIIKIHGQYNAIQYCKDNTLPYSVLVKKLKEWNEYKFKVIKNGN